MAEEQGWELVTGLIRIAPVADESFYGVAVYIGDEPLFRMGFAIQGPPEKAIQLPGQPPAPPKMEWGVQAADKAPRFKVTIDNEGVKFFVKKGPTLKTVKEH